LKIHDLLYSFGGAWSSSPADKLWAFAALSLLFAALGRVVRGVTTSGAVAGALVCFALLRGAGLGGFITLLTVFLLTWTTTRIGYARKQSLGTAEANAGRDASQVFANLGVAALCAMFHMVLPDQRLLIAMGAALSEAAADTVSSEIGQAVGNAPRLITNWNPVPAGTDGAITVAGTLAGLGGAFVVGLTCTLSHIFGWRSFTTCAGAALTGMLADSFLGATLERRGVLRNNAVNFLSTASAALIALLFS
jgi:uncharacterized protein (TIGR00297 family)